MQGYNDPCSPCTIRAKTALDCSWTCTISSPHSADLLCRLWLMLIGSSEGAGDDDDGKKKVQVQMQIIDNVFC